MRIGPPHARRLLAAAILGGALVNLAPAHPAASGRAASVVGVSFGQGARRGGQASRPGDLRDPFRPPFVGVEARPPGLVGLRIAEAVVRGILRTRDHAPPSRPAEVAEAQSAGPPGFEAVILESPWGEGFVAIAGARLSDGFLLRVEADGVTFRSDHEPPRDFFRPLVPPPEDAATARRERRRP